MALITFLTLQNDDMMINKQFLLKRTDIIVLPVNKVSILKLNSNNSVSTILTYQWKQAI